jgi:hypothetical protein
MEIILVLIVLAVAYALLDAYVIPEGPFKLVIRAIVVIALVIWLLTSGLSTAHSLVHTR